MMQAGQYAQGNAIIKAAVLLTGKSICIHVGVSEGENKSLQHAFYNTLNGIELCGDPALLNTMQNCPKTIHLWLITNSIEPHYELIKTASPSCSITENNEDTDDGYQTDQDALAQLEIDVQESGHVKPGQNCWKKTGTMAERVLDETCLIVSRHCFFEAMQKKSYDLEITDDVISLVLPIELLEQRTDKKRSAKPKTTASASEDSLDGYLTDEELYTQLESETQDVILENSICVRTDEKYWKKTGIRGQRVLKEDECFSTMNLSKERHAFFKEMHKKSRWTNMIISDTEISIMLPIKLGTK